MKRMGMHRSTATRWGGPQQGRLLYLETELFFSAVAPRSASQAQERISPLSTGRSVAPRGILLHFSLAMLAPVPQSPHFAGFPSLAAEVTHVLHPACMPDALSYKHAQRYHTYIQTSKSHGSPHARLSCSGTGGRTHRAGASLIVVSSSCLHPHLHDFQSSAAGDGGACLDIIVRRWVAGVRHA